MPEENIDLVRSIFAAWEGGDYTSTAWAHPEIEFVFADDLLRGSSKGLAGLAEGWGDFLAAWEDFRVKAEEYRELDGERVLVLVAFGGRGKTSGLEVARMRMKGANLFHLRGSKVTRLVLYDDYERALADLGLAPGLSE
jgi:ketosteroid isomerase-like protein